jgi:hypothetical protein
MGSPSLLPPDPPEPAPTPAPRRRETITCEFCQCTLTPAGEYLQLSDHAKSLRDQGERIDALKAELADSQAAVADAARLLDEARAKIAQLEAAPQKRPLW